MSKMMDRWLQKAKEGDKGMTRPPASTHISQHKNEVRSIARGFFARRLRLRCGVFGSSIAGERLKDVCPCTTTMLS